MCTSLFQCIQLSEQSAILWKLGRTQRLWILNRTLMHGRICIQTVLLLLLLKIKGLLSRVFILRYILWNCFFRLSVTSYTVFVLPFYPALPKTTQCFVDTTNWKKPLIVVLSLITIIHLFIVTSWAHLLVMQII